MVRKLCLLVAFFILSAGISSAQTADARKTLEAASKAMGAVNVKTIQYTGRWLVLSNRTDLWACRGLAAL